MKIFYLFLLIFLDILTFQKKILTDWRPPSRTMIRWPLELPPNLVIELANDELLYVLVENGNQQTQADTASNNCGINLYNIMLIETSIYTHYTIDYIPKFLIGDESWQIIKQQFNGYPEKNGRPEDCNNMIFIVCEGNEFCHNQPDYSELG